MVLSNCWIAPWFMWDVASPKSIIKEFRLVDDDTCGATKVRAANMPNASSASSELVKAYGQVIWRLHARIMNDSTAGLSVRFLKNTISAEIRGPADFKGKTLNPAR